MLGSHFDDIELGVGGTLIRHVEKGDNISLVVTNSDEFRTGEPVVRYKEQKEVMSILKLHNLATFNFNDYLPRIIEDLDFLNVELIYCPWDQDTHQDHIQTSQIGKAVSRKGANLFYYDSGSALNFNPNVFVEIDRSKKLKLLKCFKSQKIDYLKFELRDAYWGCLAFLKSGHAEGLVLGRMVYNP